MQPLSLRLEVQLIVTASRGVKELKGYGGKVCPASTSLIQHLVLKLVLRSLFIVFQPIVCLTRLPADRTCSRPEPKPQPKKRRKNRRMLFRQMKDRRATRKIVSIPKSGTASNACNPAENFKGFTECETSESFSDCMFMKACLQNSKVTGKHKSLYSRD